MNPKQTCLDHDGRACVEPSPEGCGCRGERQLTAEDGRRSLEAHAVAKGLEVREKYGPRIGWNEMMRLFEDRALVRYPCRIAFDAEPLREGEFAHPVATGERPEEGFTMVVHPYFSAQPDRVPALVLYQLVSLNYGPFASAADAEAFGAAALGISRDEYYNRLCEAADELLC